MYYNYVASKSRLPGFDKSSKTKIVIFQNDLLIFTALIQMMHVTEFLSYAEFSALVQKKTQTFETILDIDIKCCNC